MPDNSREFLVIAAEGADIGTFPQFAEDEAALTHRLPPRLALVRVRDPAALPTLPGLTYLEEPTDAGLPADLTPGERLFIEAWRERERQREHPTTRRGDGLPWDSPGFEPPDLPPR